MSSVDEGFVQATQGFALLRFGQWESMNLSILRLQLTQK